MLNSVHLVTRGTDRRTFERCSQLNNGNRMCVYNLRTFTFFRKVWVHNRDPRLDYPSCERIFTPRTILNSFFFFLLNFGSYLLERQTFLDIVENFIKTSYHLQGKIIQFYVKYYFIVPKHKKESLYFYSHYHPLFYPLFLSVLFLSYLLILEVIEQPSILRFILFPVICKMV